VNDLGPPEKKVKSKKEKKAIKKQSKARKPSSPPQEADTFSMAAERKASTKDGHEDEDKAASRPSVTKPADADATSIAAVKEARKHFKSKFLRARRIEYDESGLNLNAVNKSMWKMHREIFGNSCDDDCACPSDLNLLVDAVKDDNEDHFKSTYKAVGFAKNFAPKFYYKLKEEFPHASPVDLLKKLEKMWFAHVNDVRFGPRCRKKCACGEAWKSLFLDQCLRPKKQAAIPKKIAKDAEKAKESIPKKPRDTVPSKKRSAPKAASTTSAADTPKSSSGSGSSITVPKKKRKTEATSTSKPSGVFLGKTTFVPNDGKMSATKDTSIVPLRSSGSSALTQRIKRKDRDDASSASSFVAAAAAGRGLTRPLSRPGARLAPQVKMKEYSVSFDSKEPLGFFVVTENQQGQSICKITSVSPMTTAKDARIQDGTIVVGTGIVKTPVGSHGELRRRYEEERSATGGNFILHFINAHVTASNVPNAVNSQALGWKKGDWSKSGAFRGFSRVGGWDGCSKKLQNQQDLEGAEELKSSRARHMPSVSRYLPRGSMNSHVGRSSAKQVSHGGSSIRGKVGPIQSILKKDGDSTTKLPAQESSGAAKDTDVVEGDEDTPKETKIKFVSDEDLEQVKIFSEADDYQNITEEPIPPPGLRPGGNDSLSYTVEHKTYEDVLRLLEEGAHVNSFDSEGVHPMDRATRKYDAFKKQRQELRARPASQVVAELERVETAMKDADLKYRIMKLYRDAERIIDLAEALKLKMWSKMEITVKGVRRLDLTPKARNHASKNLIFHKFQSDGGSHYKEFTFADRRVPSKTPLKSSSDWPNEEKHLVEFKNDTTYKEEHESQCLDITLFKGDPNGPNLRLTKWRDSLDRIRNFSQRLEVVEGNFHKNEYIHDGCLLLGKIPTMICTCDVLFPISSQSGVAIDPLTALF